MLCCRRARRLSMWLFHEPVSNMTELLTRGAENAEEMRLAAELMAKTQWNYFDAIHWMESTGEGYPGYAREHTRMAFWNGEIAGALRLTTDTIRIGEARLKMGGLGWVATASRHRNKGVARTLIGDALHYMKLHQYHVAMLFGIPNFYHRFGFTTSLAEYATTTAVAEATQIPHSPYRMRSGKPGDIPALQRIHMVNDAETACSLVRSAAHITNKWGRWKPVQVITNADGKVLGYFLAHGAEDTLYVDDLGIAELKHCGALIKACADAAAADYRSRIRFAGPPTHPVMQFLHQYKSTHEMQLTHNEGGMMAFINLEETLESMIPEWESLLSRSAARTLKTDLVLLVDKKAWRIRAHRGVLDAAQGNGSNKLSLNPAELMHLITGYRYLDEILSTRRRMLSADAKLLLAALFPKRTPYVWGIDRF